MTFLYPKDLTDITEWAGVIFAIAGALIIASNIGLVGLGYFLFFVSSIFFMVFSARINKRPLFLMNLIFAVINIWGMWRWFI